MIPPHVLTTDALGALLTDLIKTYKPKTILEIGASEGTGSTKVLAEAMKGEGKLFAIELEADRFLELRKNVEKYENVFPYHCSTVGIKGMVELQYLVEFKRDHPDFNTWQCMAFEPYCDWWMGTKSAIQDIDIKEGIKLIKKENDIKFFDMVFIDGGPFTAMAELDEVYGAQIIVLDDTMDIKCHGPYLRLKSDPKYKMVACDEAYRNGFAAFVKL